MDVVVTGSSGFIGSALVPALRAAGHDVRRLVRRPVDFRIGAQPYLGIVAHEVGSHLLEAENGRRSPLRLLASGLRAYEHGNEGRAPAKNRNDARHAERPVERLLAGHFDTAADCSVAEGGGAILRVGRGWNRGR